MEPQGKVWPREAGQQYIITSPKMCSTLTPFEGISGFSTGIATYSATLFRFPLRLRASGLSDRCYDISKLKELLEALKDEAQFLLIFLRSVVVVSVVEISASGDHNAIFEVSINDSERDRVTDKRQSFLKDLKSSNLKVRKSTYSIRYEAKFHVTAEDMVTGEALEKHWLVTTVVGSDKPEDLQAASKQKVLPWVGCALELDNETIDDSGGRIFCFLPLPHETRSPLPVHVNGTFGLNDNRRSLKWPSKERKHDSTADWNTTIVKSLLPQCYALLIKSSISENIPSHYVYNSWPKSEKLKRTPWSGLMLPLFEILFQLEVFWSEKSPNGDDGMWISLQNATIITSEISTVVQEVLSACGLNLVDYRSYPHIQDAIRVGNKKVTELSSALARQTIRSQKGTKYRSLSPSDKHDLLHYCLLDGKFNELEGLELLPLANGSFLYFAQANNSNHCYVCNDRHHCDLLPNLQCLVDLSSHNLSLHKELLKVASSNKTQLQKLNPEIVAHLLTQCMPPEWTRRRIVPISGSVFSRGWFEIFWDWIARYNLDLFKDQMVLPVLKHNSQKSELCIARLVSKSTVIFITDDCVLARDRNLMRGLEKFDVYFTGTTDNLFPYLQNCKSLREYVNSTTPHSVLNALVNAYSDHEQLQKLQSITVTVEEAESIQHFLADLKEDQKNILLHLPIFKCVNHEVLHSIATAARDSWGGKAVMITNSSTSGFESNVDLLPPNVVLLCCTYDQKRLVHLHTDLVIRLDRVEFIRRYLFPMIVSHKYPQSKVEHLMKEILEQLPSLKLDAKHSKVNLVKEIKNIPFLRKDSKGTLVPPCDLFDPSKVQLVTMLQEELFPKPPFNKDPLLHQLRECGLRQTVTAQEIVEIIHSISSKPPTTVEVSRAKAVLAYLDSNHSLLEEKAHYRHKDVQLKKALQDISDQRKWLPQQGNAPEYYPSRLEWKGKSCPTLVSLGSETLVCSPNNIKRDSLKVGSAVCVVLCPQSLSIALRSAVRVKMVVKHLKEVIRCCDNLDKSDIDMIMDCVYEYLQKKDDSYKELRTSLPSHWIWVSKIHKFLSTKSVSLERNPNLQHDLEPYAYVLPDAMQRFSSLFKAMGVKECITNSQLLTVLTTIKNSNIDSKEAWMTVMAILSSLTLHGKEVVELKSCQVLYVPISSKHLCLEDSQKVCYADFDFLQDFVASKEETENEDTYVLCHESIRHMAHHLQLTPLSKYYDISEDLFEDFGPHEPLVLRLKNILRDYTDGFTIVKELVQNADDADATEVNLCYDSRQHHVNPKTLLYSGMAECSGPALVVHNDAVFTDNDFQNITRLAAATKKDKPLKIGKFGVGFCSVYHITDVPCFVSRDYLYIFDPTLQYLKEHIRDKSRPGKRLRFTQKIATFSKQLSPFVGLNGFQSKKPFDGTMFRFPFRTCGSEISPIQYTEHHIDQLIEDIRLSGSKLLLFLQNVNRISFSRIDEGDENPRVLLDVHKETLPSLYTDAQMLRVHTVHDTGEADFSHWLVGYHTEKLDIGSQESDATSSVACLMNSSSESELYGVTPIRGEVFCFLPLSLQSGLPVHVSANFAVLNDRTGIRSSKEYGTGANEAEWNLDLMKSTIPKAYLNLLLCLSFMYKQGTVEEGYMCYSLWPLKEQLTVRNPWEALIAPLYSFASEKSLLFSIYTKSWLTLSESQFLTPNIFCSNRDGIPESVQECVKVLQMPVVNLPLDYECNFPRHPSLLELDFVKIFFSKIGELESHSDIRNDILCLIFQAYSHGECDKRTDLENILQVNKCVPCTPDGNVLEYCNSTIDPRAFFADLYEPTDRVFPIKEFQNPPTNQALIDLGMITETLHLSKVAERAETIETLYYSDQTRAVKRAELVLKCISKDIAQSVRTSVPSAQYVYHTRPAVCNNTEKLKTVRYLPVKHRPEDYPEFLSWKGDNRIILAPDDIYCGEHCAILAGSQVCVVCTESPDHGGCGIIEERVIAKLAMRTMPEFSDVVTHLCHVIEVVTSKMETADFPEDCEQWVTSACSEIYKFLEECLKGSQYLDVSELNNLPCVWTGSCFVHSNLVASAWAQNGPYLFRLPSTLINKPTLEATLGIETQFSVHTYIETLEKIRNKYLHEPVDKKCQEFLVVLVAKLSLQIEKVTDRRRTCYLPDSNFVMQKATDLEYNDAEWCKADESSTATYVNSNVPRDIAIKLGVRPVRAKFLDSYEDTYDGEEFGQSEDLTQRIKNILQDYPLDITVLKELLQNADDAKATKMFIILDKRTHGMKTLPSDEWKDLQGPALLVWNNSTFCEEDLRGIQKLGLGSKRSESETIGMYGIGFNVVYHLTDCPSFISTKKDGNSTLCVLDPHCRYIPGAKKLRPGRRFNNLDQKFWKQWSDLRSAYLRDDITELPEEITYGTLFRFPLRHSLELVANSQLAIEPSERMQAYKMEEYLKKWAPDMKETLFFLNNVTELQFFVIDSDKVSQTQYFKVTIDDEGQKCRDRMQETVRNFLASAPSPHVESYTLTLTERVKNHEETEPEKWLIQQGIGDINNPEQSWLYLPRMKPKHGIAAPLFASERSDMRVFCFLPLPTKSNLPVHINGSFVLHSSRRQLWQPTTSNYTDDKTKWNQNLMEAIASSYTHLLVNFWDTSISPIKKATKDALIHSIDQYYRTFPVWLPQCGYAPEADCLILAKMVYDKIYEENPSILAHLEEEDEGIYSVDFLPLVNDVEPQDQPYFYDGLSEELVGVIRNIGMRLTEAPTWLYKHFLDRDKALCTVTRQSVFTYYSQFYRQVFSADQLLSTYSDGPELVTETKFGSVRQFKTFTEYVLEPSYSEDTHFRCLQFLHAPLNIPLLLTADGCLRKFDWNNKAIRSEFSSLFAESRDKFLHPELMDVKYVKDYFLKPSAQHWGIVNDIMSRTIPDKLQCAMVLDASTCLNHDTLKQIWKCLNSEEFFLVHLKKIIETWALVPSTTNELFSLKCTFLPIIEGTEDYMRPTQPSVGNIMKILGKLGMPKVDLNVVQQKLAETICPKVSHPAAIVKNLFHLHQKRKVLDDTAAVKPVVKQLLEYCGTIHLGYDTTSLSRVKALPLFRNIDGRFCSIPKGAYIWPGNVCEEGKDLWLQDEDCVFLDSQGDWMCLNATEALGIKNISPFKLYSKFIFSVFHNLTEQQRLCHLEIIRDSLYESAEHNAKFYTTNYTYVDAEEFLKCLKKLCFIPKADGTLCPVCDFADPEKSIFTIFGNHFQFPPPVFHSNKWLAFLHKIGLRTSITTQEYLQFCYEVNCGKHSDLKSASHTLTDYLFQEKDWHSKIYFLSEVSKIAFVCVEPLPGVSWIHPCAQPEKCELNLTSLAKAADYEHYKLIWTVKPVVRLPSYPDHSFHLAKQKRRTLLQSLNVSTVTAKNVVKNIQNISSTKFSDFQNFETYSCGKPPKDGVRLLDVMSDNYEFLKDSIPNMPAVLSPLKNIPCIPVCAEGNIDVRMVVHPVLVKPLQVIALASDSIREFMPFLTCLPNVFYSILPSILVEIGVEQAVMLKHVQGALETIHKCTEQTLGVNTQPVVKNLIRKLYELLYNQQKYTDSRSICDTLYLPNSKYILVDSRTLLYQDSEHFRKKTLNFEESQYSELYLLVRKRDIFSHYKFHEKDLCDLLPSAIAPKPLTTSCKEVMSESCRTETSLSSLALGLRHACKLPLLTAGACAILKHNSNPPELCERLKRSLDVFFRNCEVFTVKNLTVNLWLEVEQPAEHIGIAEVDFHIEKKTDATFSLYIDKDARKILFFENLSTAILSLAAEMSGVHMKGIKEPQAALTHLLKAESSNEIRSTLREMGVSADVSTGVSDDPMEDYDPLNPVLGNSIPESWHHRLLQDYNNLFRPGEWVGYEMGENIVFASIGYKVVGKEGMEDFASYCIYLEEGEYEGIIANVLDIYKIRQSAVRKHGTQELKAYAGGGERPSEGTQEEPMPENFIEIKREINEELKRIWNLPEDMKRKAIKRMYLKWHPDKNLDNTALAGEAFKYLKQQIERLEQGKPMSDPDAPEEEDSTTYRDFTSRNWESFFRAWDNTAHSHSRYQQREQSWFSGFSSDHGRSSHSEFNFNFTTPDVGKARIWIRQAECDSQALSILSDNNCPEVCANICFLAHEVAEKSLKAGMLAAWGLQSKDFTNHKKMFDFACNLEQKHPELSAKGLRTHVMALPTERFYYKTRWPNMYPGSHQLPADNFDEDMAAEAKSHAYAILDMVRSVVVVDE